MEILKYIQKSRIKNLYMHTYTYIHTYEYMCILFSFNESGFSTSILIRIDLRGIIYNKYN